jgi:hypothetical protein
MTYTVQELALQYAEKLVAYHQAIQSNVQVDLDNHPDNPKNWGGDHNDHAAWNELHDAQTELNHACERAAELRA